MTRILMRAAKDPFLVAEPAQTLHRNLVATNPGNLVFSQAAYRSLALPDTTIDTQMHFKPADAGRINERYDAFVIPLANAFRPSFERHLVPLIQLIRRLKIPVVVLGVGGQGSLDYSVRTDRSIDDRSKKFAAAVLERSATIGVRGEFTRDYLASLGIPADSIEIIGCPSMFWYGDRFPEIDRPELTPESPIAINISPYVKRMGPIATSTYRRYRDLIYVAQDNDTLARLLWGEGPSTAAEIDEVPIHVSHPLFQDRKVRMYVDPTTWITDLANREFCFGSRIHGNIAGLLAGTPSFVLAHDSRTRELSDYFEIPWKPITEVDADVDAADLARAADWNPMQTNHRERFDRFTSFMERNGLKHALGGDDARQFDEQIAQVHFPPPVGAPPEPADGASLRWLKSHAVERLGRAEKQISTLTERNNALTGRLDKAIGSADDGVRPLDDVEILSDYLASQRDLVKQLTDEIVTTRALLDDMKIKLDEQAIAVPALQRGRAAAISGWVKAKFWFRSRLPARSR